MFSISRFHSLMQSLPLGAFDRAVKQLGTDRHCKGFSSQRHLRIMVFAQLSQAHSLRAVEDAFNSHPTHHYHLDCKAVRRTTLADANGRRDPRIFAAAASALMQQCGRDVRQHRQQMLYLLDSTTINLDGRGFQWAQQQTTRSKGLKLHVLYDPLADQPVYHSITPVNVNDLDEGKRVQLQRGATYVFDKAYCDYSWWWQFGRSDAVFVTRLKRNAALKLIEQRTIDPQHAGCILRDEVCSFKYRSSRGGHRNAYEGKVRVVQVQRQDSAQTLELVTNDLKRPAHEIAQLYKQRWQIELFFKWVKQHLNVKRFMGRSENAVRIQLLVALITFLLVKLYQLKTRTGEPMNRTLNTLRSTLMHPEQDSCPHRRRRRAHQHELASRQYSFI